MTITMSSAHSPSFPSLHLHHSSFSYPSIALPTSQLILQPFRCFTYVTVHSPTLLLLLLHHRLFTYVTWRSAHGVKNWWYMRGPVSGIYLFTRGHVLHLGSETVAVLRRMNMMWMINDVLTIHGDECGPNFLTFVSQLRKTAEKLQPGNYPALKYSMDTLEERLRRYLWATAVVRAFNKTKLFCFFHLTFRKQCK